MNLRFSKNTVRVRIEPEEARRLLAGEPLALELFAGPQAGWTLRLERTEAEPLELRFEDAELRMKVPERGLAEALSRAPSKSAGVYGAQATEGRVWQLAVEIDVQRPRSGDNTST